MKTKKYFIIPALACLAVACQDNLQEVGVTAQPGKEVIFGASLGENTITTRTIYGAETDTYYPIYWVDGDEVIVTSPECGAERANGGVGSATYSVSVNSATQSYATDLTKTGDIGVRWGENETGTFYSVYPESNASFGSDYTTVTLTMPQQQDCDFTYTYNESSGKKEYTVYPNMDACFMYAKTTDVENGATVNLRYIPISTAIRFTLQGPSTGNNEVTITSINFSAPEGTYICGTFETDLEDVDSPDVPTMEVVSGYNVVSINAVDESTRGYLSLGTGETAEMNVFLLLAGDEDVTVDANWKITIRTGDGSVYTKSLELSGGNTLIRGQVHELPPLPALDSKDWDVSNWMTNIPRNVYLSEISIPGSWNSVNSDYQRGTDGTDITTQYEAGVRAFHLDTRWRRDYVIFSGYQYDLGIANGGRTSGSEGSRYMTTDAPTFESILSTLAGLVAEDEYIVVMCTFAQSSADYNRDNGGWEAEIGSICANYGKVIDAKTLNQNSVVADALGKIIVIINSDNTFTNLTSSPCLFFNMGMTLDQTEFTGSDYYQRALSYGNGNGSGITMYGTHANISTIESGYDSSRGYVPSLTERETKAGNILSWSKNNYDNQDDYAHDAWLYLGLGGYTSDDESGYNEVAEELNGWIEDKIAEMESGYYPVGLVFMNNAIDYPDAVKNILMLNNKYRKAYDENRSSDNGSYLTVGTSTTSVR